MCISSKTQAPSQAHHLAEEAAGVAEEVPHVRVGLDLVELLDVVRRREHSRRATAL